MECKGIFHRSWPYRRLTFSHRFRWVFCQLEVLRQCFPANLRRTLEELPKSLDETYKRILKEINNVNWDHAYRLLQCLVVASRPLRVEELAEVLTFDFTGGIPKPNADWRWEDQEAAVLSACSSLVSVVSNDGSRVVQFAHFSVKEFMTSVRLASSTEEVSGFHVTLEPAHTTLAQACLGVLLRLEGDSDTKTHTPLVQYAAENWVTHARFENVELRMKDALDYFFDTDRPHFLAWVQIHDVDRSRSARVDSRTPRTPLYYAALCGFRDLVERLIVRYPKQISAPAGRYGTPLHATLVEGGHVEVSELLIERGADVNALNEDKSIPLHFASQFGHLDVAKRLLAHGASVNSKTNVGWTPLHSAAYLGRFQIARILLENKARVNIQDSDGRTPLHRALEGPESGNLKSEVVRLLLDHNANVHVDDKRGKTPLHFAASHGGLEATRILLECDADVNSRDHHGSTPLLLASEYGHTEVVQLLLEHNAEVHVRDGEGETPLHCAALGGQLEVTRILLALNVDVNSRNHHGTTPLLHASENGHADVVQFLLDHNADVTVRDNDGDTPLHCAMAGGQLEVARILLELNVDVNSRNYHGSTPLLYASENGPPDVVRFLLDHNADVNVRDKDGDTPLHCAALAGQLEIAWILLGLNVEVNSRNDEGSTTLHRASEGDPEGNPDVVRLLLDHGADVQVRNLRGKTASEVARGRRRQEIVQLISQHAAE
jgi:ankyrin repeat protein